MLNTYFKKVYFGEDLTGEESEQAMSIIMEGKASSVEIAAFLVSLHLKGETSTEIASFARIMREKSLGISMNCDLVDTCGTGGDQKNLFNVSTATALTVAACGVRVAKHGNRAVSSSSGSADILADLGVNIELKAAEVARCIEKVGIGFLFAQGFHPAMKYVGPIRQELGVRTVFNILGPLANPFKASKQIMGVFDSKLIGTVIQVLKLLGNTAAIAVHSEDGMDEISVFAPTHAQFFNQKEDIRDLLIEPKQYELAHPETALSSIQVDSKEKAMKIFLDAITGKNPVARDMVILNSAVTLWISGRVKKIEDGIRQAKNHIQTGKVKSLLIDYVKFSNEIAIS